MRCAGGRLKGQGGGSIRTSNLLDYRCRPGRQLP